MPPLNLFVLLFFCGAASAQGVKADNGTITLHYYNRPPFLYQDAAGHVKGILAERAEKVMQQAGIHYRWENTPVTRILYHLEHSKRHDCAPGWYFSAEREKFAWYSKPVYRDLPVVVISRAQPFSAAPGNLASILNTPGVRILLKRGLLHNSELQEQLRKPMAAKIETTVAEMPVMLGMIENGRADLTIVTQEEASYYASLPQWSGRQLKISKIPGLNTADARYILCSKTVPAELMQKINTAIDKVLLP
ncbi:substrate-binding periplasmic protein [Undibacterium squillarum]|uniref:Solute-binding protein family 3/N-terminal domain-containing protein n=1 Tax=Undibacterium squillarum TaxID=1131567 RepID=A0ABQ2XUZ1_9BURK|nr:transporter substrate-binding domain-containing protein [Undibacterium squillarum]GGX33975.1 hypothetical protein GCM10010946_08860 [Undibacterium squillarum]